MESQIWALVRLIPRATILEGSHGHIRIPLDVSIYIIFIIIYILLIYSFGPITFQDGGSGYQTKKRPNLYVGPMATAYKCYDKLKDIDINGCDTRQNSCQDRSRSGYQSFRHTVISPHDYSQYITVISSHLNHNKVGLTVSLCRRRTRSRPKR